MRLIFLHISKIKYPHSVFQIIICLFISLPFCLFSQAELNIATLKKIEGSFEQSTKILDFNPVSLILQSKKRFKKEFLEHEIQIDKIKSISIKYDYSTGRGAAKGLLKGTLIGLGIGLLSSTDTGDQALKGNYIAVGTLMGGVLGTLFGLAGGSYRKKNYTIDGNITIYQTHLAEMQELLIKE